MIDHRDESGRGGPGREELGEIFDRRTVDPRRGGESNIGPGQIAAAIRSTVLRVRTAACQYRIIQASIDSEIIFQRYQENYVRESLGISV